MNLPREERDPTSRTYKVAPPYVTEKSRSFVMSSGQIGPMGDRGVALFATRPAVKPRKTRGAREPADPPPTPQ